MRIPAFWDTSALVPLCVQQNATAQAIALYKIHDAAVWWTTPVEIASAFARLVRMKQLSASGWSKARKLAQMLADSWFVIEPSNTLRTKSIQLLDRYDLRAADSLQLAAALEWCEDDPQGRPFLSADQRLAGAARLSGFDVKQL
jgi:predicted nucleic acid-binding protein